MANRTIGCFTKVILIAGLTLVGPASSIAASLSLLQAQELARSNNAELHSVEQGLFAARARRQKGNATYYPKLGVEFGYDNFGTARTNRDGTYSNLFLNLEVFAGGRDFYQNEALTFEEEQAQTKYEKLRLTLDWEVERGFSRKLFLEKSLVLYDEAIARNSAQLQAAQVRRRAGLVSDADIYEFELYESLLKSDANAVRGELAEATAELEKLMGVSLSNYNSFEGSLSHFHLKESLESLVSRSAKESDRLHIARLEQERSSALRKSFRGSFLPTVSLHATRGQRGLSDSILLDNAVWTVARWEFFSGFESYYGYKEAVYNESRAEGELRAKENEVQSDLRKSYSNLMSLEARVDLEARNRERAKKYFDIVAGEYKRGVKNSPDLRGASEQLLQSNLRDLRYRYEHIAEKIRLQSVVGGTIKVVSGSSEGHVD